MCLLINMKLSVLKIINGLRGHSQCGTIIKLTNKMCINWVWGMRHAVKRTVNERVINYDRLATEQGFAKSISWLQIWFIVRFEKATRSGRQAKTLHFYENVQWTNWQKKIRLIEPLIFPSRTMICHCKSESKINSSFHYYKCSCCRWSRVCFGSPLFSQTQFFF